MGRQAIPSAVWGTPRRRYERKSCGDHHLKCKQSTDLRADRESSEGCDSLGRAHGGRAAPSIRALANSLRVSVITTKRAYTDLEAAGFIETVQGKGCFVAGGNAELIREEQLRGIEELFGKAVAEGRTIGLSDGELQEMFALALEV